MCSPNFAILNLFVLQWCHNGNPGSTGAFSFNLNVSADVMHSFTNTEKTEPFSFLPPRAHYGGIKSNPIVFHNDPYVAVMPLGANHYIVRLRVLGNIDQ